MSRLVELDVVPFDGIFPGEKVIAVSNPMGGVRVFTGTYLGRSVNTRAVVVEETRQVTELRHAETDKQFREYYTVSLKFPYPKYPGPSDKNELEQFHRDVEDRRNKIDKYIADLGYVRKTITKKSRRHLPGCRIFRNDFAL